MTDEERTIRDLINDLTDALGITRAQAEGLIRRAQRDGYQYGS